jgi:four helix bundle suffix protein
MPDDALILPHGGYRRLKSFQVAQLVYDLTVRFCDRYVDRFSRTRDQMVQAARSGVQNIAEGSQASATSKKTEITLTHVARASLEELKRDYEDFLRQHGLAQWPGDDPLRQALIDRRCQSAGDVAERIVEQAKGLHGGGQGGQCGQSGQGQRQEKSEGGGKGQRGAPDAGPGKSGARTRVGRAKLRERIYPELSANAALVLIAVACSLIDRQVASLAETFEEEGGFTERLHRIRSARRRRR